MTNPWFRMYSEFSTDPKVQMLSEVDQRRFVMRLCMRCSEGDCLLSDGEIAFQLRIAEDEWKKTKGALIQKGLLDEQNNIKNWDKRQFNCSNSNQNSVVNSSNYVYFVVESVVNVDNFVVKIGISKNPWARVKDLQTGNKNKLVLAANFKADVVSDAEIHEILNRFRIQGEWFKLPPLLASEIIKLNKKKSRNYVELRRTIVEKLRSFTTVATFSTTDTDTDTENNRTRKKFSRPSFEQVRDYCKSRGNGIDPQGFLDFYDSKGWKIGKNPMVDWQAAVRTWERTGSSDSNRDQGELVL